MYCKNCSTILNSGAAICTSCGAPSGVGNNYCQGCGVKVDPSAVVCVNCGSPLKAQSIQPNYMQPQKTTTSGTAIASLVLGIVSVVSCGGLSFLGIVGIILAIIAKNDIKKTGQSGNDLATAGLILSIIGTVILVFMVLILVVSFVSAAYIGGEAINSY